MINHKIAFVSALSPLPVTHKIVACGPACQQTTANIHQAKAGLGSQVVEFFTKLLDTTDWPPRWHCGNWSDFHGWFYILSDIAIWASYFAIPILLAKVVTRRSDIPFPKIIYLFIAFIVLCGTTHLLDALIFWWPVYRISALVRFFTAVVSMAAVITLYKIMPLILSLRSVDELEREINERKLVEEKLYHSHQQLRMFTYILSHNIRNHSSNISLLTDLVDHSTLDAGNLELFDKITKVSHGLNNTLNDLSEAIKIRESNIESEKLSFEETAKSVIGILGSDLTANGAVIKYDFMVESVMFPKIYLESTLMNLISNAVKYQSPGIPLQITLRTYMAENGRVTLECIDNGLGIDLDLYGTKIFGLYKTFHAHKDAHGVGLFLVKTQVESQGGTISVESIPGHGATFKILFS